jgi:hypothetical protein
MAADVMINRRSIIAGLITAPMIVRPGSIMRIRRIIVPVKTNCKITARITGGAVMIGSDFYPGDYIVRTSPLHGVLRVGDSVWIDQNTGEVI